MIHWLGASLIGAFFVCAPITQLHAQPTAAEEWQPGADVLTLRQPGKVEANAPPTASKWLNFSATPAHCATFAPN